MFESANASPVWHADHHRDVKASLRARPVARAVVLDLVEALEGEARELDLADGLEPVEGHPDRRADDGRLGERAVDHPLATKFSMEVLGHAEDAAVAADVLADDDDVLVPLHLLEQRQVQRLDHVQFCHRLVFRWPRMGGDGGGSGAAVLSSGLRSREATSSRWARSSGGFSAYA